MKSKAVAVFLLLLISNIGSVWAGDYSFSGYKADWFGADNKSRMCTVSFSVDESSPAREVVAAFRFINTGKAPVKGDPFSSQKVEIISKDGKTYEVPWDVGMVELKDGSRYEVQGKVTPEKVEEVVVNHPELREESSFEELVSPLKEAGAESKKKSGRLINPGGTVEKVFYASDPAIRALVESRNIEQVIFHSGMGKFVLREQE